MSKNSSCQDEFIEKVKKVLDKQYRKALSDNIKRGVAKAKEKKNESKSD